MARRSNRSNRRPWGAPHPDLDFDRARGGGRVEQAADGVWTIRQIGAQAATKSYRCPGCQQEIGPGTPHVVAWQSDALLGAESAVELRRHWHTSCWRHRRDRR